MHLLKRKDYRHFRMDRIQSLTILKERYPPFPQLVAKRVAGVACDQVGRRGPRTLLAVGLCVAAAKQFTPSPPSIFISCRIA
jgi:predicted DNA-binding transcriptional regulator YafY